MYLVCRTIFDLLMQNIKITFSENFLVRLVFHNDEFYKLYFDRNNIYQCSYLNRSENQINLDDKILVIFLQCNQYRFDKKLFA